MTATATILRPCPCASSLPFEVALQRVPHPVINIMNGSDLFVAGHSHVLMVLYKSLLTDWPDSAMFLTSQDTSQLHNHVNASARQ